MKTQKDLEDETPELAQKITNVIFDEGYSVDVGVFMAAKEFIKQNIRGL